MAAVETKDGNRKSRVLVMFHGRPGRQYLVGIRSDPGSASSRNRSSFHDLDAIGSGGSRGGLVHRHHGEQDMPEPDAILPIAIGKSWQLPAHPNSPDEEGFIDINVNERGEDLESPQKMGDTDADAEARKAVGTSRRAEGLSEFSGFSSDQDSAQSSASLAYTQSSDDESSVGISQLLHGTDDAVQTDPMLGRSDACVETNVLWSSTGFKCKCCSRPPRAPLDKQRNDVLASSLPQRRRRRRPSKSQSQNSAPTPESLDGTWAINPQFHGIAQEFMHRLTFLGDRCIDAAGQRWKLHHEGNNTYLIKGRIWIADGDLYREGKSGIVMKFNRTAEEQVDLLDDDELPSSSPQSHAAGSADPLVVEDSLAVLESIIAQHAPQNVQTDPMEYG